jgi:hypothetical protein
VPEIDTAPYTASLDGNTIVMVSGVGVRAKVSVTKKFTAIIASQAIDVEYVLKNEDTVAASWAPWEISRVGPNGLTFFPTGSKTVKTDLPVQNMNNVTWYQHPSAGLPASGFKFTADGSGGWLAHATSGGVLMLKKFPDLTPEQQAPAPEAEVEIYAAPGYVEVEPQGPYTMLAPGASVSWTVRWYLRQVPASAMIAVGNAELVSFAQSVAAQ